MSAHSMELLTCDSYGCPGCDYRHFLRTSDSSRLTEVPEAGLYTREELARLGQAAIATGAVPSDR